MPGCVVESSTSPRHATRQWNLEELQVRSTMEPVTASFWRTYPIPLDSSSIPLRGTALDMDVHYPLVMVAGRLDLQPCVAAEVIGRWSKLHVWRRISGASRALVVVRPQFPHLPRIVTEDGRDTDVTYEDACGIALLSLQVERGEKGKGETLSRRLTCTTGST